MRAAWWEKIHLEPEEESPAKSHSPAGAAFLAIGLGGLIAGVCDLTYAVVFHAAQGVKPIRIPQSIASGLLGVNSYEGGWATAALGVALHFTIALAAAAVYLLGQPQDRTSGTERYDLRSDLRRGGLFLYALGGDSAFGRTSFQNDLVIDLDRFRGPRSSS
jgi:hypothetical protein